MLHNKHLAFVTPISNFWLMRRLHSLTYHPIQSYKKCLMEIVLLLQQTSGVYQKAAQRYMEGEEEAMTD